MRIIDYSSALRKYDSQQDLGAKIILRTKEFHKLCRKQWKRAILTHRDGANNWSFYYYPTCKYVWNMIII